MTRLELLRIDKGWTQQELADAAGVSRNTISSLERGRTGSRARVLAKIGRPLGVEGGSARALLDPVGRLDGAR